MYDEKKLFDIMLEYYFLTNLYSDMDHVQERAGQAYVFPAGAAGLLPAAKREGE